MQGAPGTVAGYFVPGMGSLGKGSRMGRLARRAAGIAANIGGTVAQNTIENPDSDFEDHKRAVIADYATSLGMKPFDHAKGKIVQKIKDHLPHRPGAGQPPSAPASAPTGHVDLSAPPPLPGQPTFSVASPDGPDIQSPPPGSPQQPHSPGVPITPTAIETRTVPGQPSSQHPIPYTTTPTTPDSDSEKQPQTTANKRQQTQTPSSAPAAAADLKEVGEVTANIQRLQDKAKDGPLSLAEQRELDHNEKVLAHTRVKNLEKEQQVIRSLPQTRELDPHKAQKLEEARAVLQRPVPGEPPAATPSQSSIPDTTSPTSPESGHPASVQSARSLPDPAKNSEAIDGIERLTDKAKTGVLSPAEKRELDQHEKTRAATRVHHLEAEQKALSELNPPRELNPVKAQALETERAILQRPEPGAPPAGGGAGKPTPVSSNSGEPSPRPLPGNDGHGGGAPPPPPPPPPSEGNSSKGSTIQGQNTADAGQHGGSATVDVPAPGPRFHEKNPDILDKHRKKFKEKRDAPRDTEAEAALLKERDERVRNAQPASEALHRHNEAGSLKFVRNMGDTNEANLLKAPDGNAAVHKPANGQSPKKMRTGIAPEKTIHREVAASKIAQALGIDLVPPTNYMTHNDRHGSAQGFKSGMSNGIDAAADHNIQLDPRTQAPVDLPPDIAHDWQLTDDLLMHSDRLAQNYMLRVENGKIAEAALVDNGLSLPANTGVVEKRFPGPLEDQPISPLNEARLHRMLDNEESLRQSLQEHLEPEAIDGLFARAKALLARGKYGNFTLDEINAHLPPDKQPSRAVHWGDKSQ